MNLPKAIEELSGLHKVGLNRLTPDEKDAIKLGIEALNLISWMRQGHIPAPDFKLPGED